MSKKPKTEAPAAKRQGFGPSGVVERQTPHDRRAVAGDEEQATAVFREAAKRDGVGIRALG
jgi:hypothetical protein